MTKEMKYVEMCARRQRLEGRPQNIKSGGVLRKLNRKIDKLRKELEYDN